MQESHKTKQFIIIILLALVVVGGWYWYSTRESLDPTPLDNRGIAEDVVDTSSWRVYRDLDRGFQLSHPFSYQMSESAPAGVPTITFSQNSIAKFSVSFISDVHSLYGSEWEEVGIKVIAGVKAVHLRERVTPGSTDISHNAYLLEGVGVAITFEDVEELIQNQILVMVEFIDNP